MAFIKASLGLGAVDKPTMSRASVYLELVYFVSIPLIFPYLVLRRGFRQVFGQKKTTSVFGRAGLATTSDFLRILRVPIGIRTWIDVNRRFDFEKEVSELLSLINGRIFADIGASLGYYSVLLSQNFKSVLAFEPHPDNVRAMREMIRFARIPNISVLPVAVSDSDGEAILYVGTFSATHSLLGQVEWTTNTRIPVRTVRLDSIVSETLDLVKIDVEGAEWRVLAGAENTIRSGRILRMLIELHDGRTRELDAYLHERGYSTKWIDEIHVLAERRERTRFEQGIVSAHQGT